MWNRRKYPRRTSPLDRRKNVLDAVIAYNKYGGYCVPISGLDRPAVQRIVAGEIDDRVTIEFLVDHIDRGDIVHLLRRADGNAQRLRQALPGQVADLSVRVDGITDHVDLLNDHVNDIHETLMHVRPFLRSAGLPSRLLNAFRGHPDK